MENTFSGEVAVSKTVSSPDISAGYKLASATIL